MDQPNQVTEIRNVYYIYKLGEERTYSTTTTPSVEWAEALKRQGFNIMLVQFKLPVPATAEAYGYAKESTP